MKKLTILSVMAFLCLNNSVRAQSMDCDPKVVSRCKYGFTSFKTGFKPETKLTPSSFNKWRRLISYNHTPIQLYAIALGAGSPISSERLIIEVKNPERLERKYCYELNTPPELVDNMFVIMLQHLQYEFPDYIATLVPKNGITYLKIEDKDWGILVSDKPLPKFKPLKKTIDTTY